MTAFDGANVIQEYIKTDIEALETYIAEDLGGVVGDEYTSPYGQGRIVIVESDPENGG